MVAPEPKHINEINILVLYFNVQRGKKPDEAAFEIPGRCPR